MTWESYRIVLACGCDGVGPWSEYEVGDGQVCSAHGEQAVVRMARIYEADTRHRYHFGEVKSP